MSGRERSVVSKANCHFMIMASLNRRLEAWCREYGWSKTKAVEYALSIWLTDRERETSNPDQVRDENLALLARIRERKAGGST